MAWISRIFDWKDPLKLSAVVIFGMNAAGFLGTAVTHTHKLTDLTGTGAFVVSSWATCAALLMQQRITTPQKPLPLRPILLTAAVTLWGVRLGSFLFQRIMNSPEDKRLAEFFPKPGELPIRLAGFWTIQALWAYITLLPVTLACRRSALTTASARISPLEAAALGCFLLGFTCEAVADHQKSAFKASSPENAKRFCNVGLWSYSRHPNYFGEMVVWWSLYAATARHVPLWGALGPAFVTMLLLFVSGIPILERKYDERFATDAEYQQYKRTTSLLVPWFKLDGNS